MQSKIIIHGGAWDIPANLHKEHCRGIEQALKAGIKKLKQTDDSVQTVLEIIRTLEDNPVFDAGRGSFLNSQGQVEMDAGIMVGKDLSAGAVAAVQNVRNPIILANLVRTKTQHVILAGQGAQSFAVENNIEIVDTLELLVGREKQLYLELKEKGKINIKSFFEKTNRSDTVGAVVVNSEGNLVAGTSTGGTPFKKAGRVGDSPIIGAGFYADDKLGGVSTTGWGEGILRIMLAREAAELLKQNYKPKQAAEESITLMHERVKGDGGVILIDRNGREAYAHNTPFMAVGVASSYEIEYVKMSSQN